MKGDIEHRRCRDGRCCAHGMQHRNVRELVITTFPQKYANLAMSSWMEVTLDYGDNRPITIHAQQIRHVQK